MFSTQRHLTLLKFYCDFVDFACLVANWSIFGGWTNLIWANFPCVPCHITVSCITICTPQLQNFAKFYLYVLWLWLRLIRMSWPPGLLCTNLSIAKETQGTSTQPGTYYRLHWWIDIVINCTPCVIDWKCCSNRDWSDSARFWHDSVSASQFYSLNLCWSFCRCLLCHSLKPPCRMFFTQSRYCILLHLSSEFNGEH